MIKDYLALECSLNRLTYQQNALLAPHSTFGIGGQADYLVFPHTEEALVDLVSFIKKHGIRFGIFGNASNVLFDEKGFRGVVIFTDKLRKVSVIDNVIEAQAGASLIAVSSLASKNSLSGLEFACGIPGTIGGAIFMNAGAHGGEMADIVLSSRFLDESGQICEITSHRFSYRDSVYQENGGIILSCRLGLSYGVKDEILARVSDNKKKRESTQPIRVKSAGSVFRRSEGVIPAALIDQAGLKGLSVGGATVSEKHAGFIVNQGGATSSQVLTLIEKIKKTVLDRFGKQLITEIRYIPER